MSRVPHRAFLVAMVTVAALAAAGCANPSSHKLLIADAPAQSTQAGPPGLSIWAVSPGDEPNDTNVLTRNARSPMEITTIDHHGLPWVNSFGREWNGSALLSYGTEQGSAVTAGAPGAEQFDIARSAQSRTTVLRRGAFVLTTEGCVLATGPESIEAVGTGSCTISSDERWVASWSAATPGLEIRDLRSDEVRTIGDVAPLSVAVLSTDARVLAVVDEGGQSRGILYDATSGDEVARTELYPILEVAPLADPANGFVLQTRTETGVEMLYLDPSGELETIDSGPFLVPITNASEVTYLRYEEDLADSALRRWSPGGEPEVLLSGYVGAASVDHEHVIAVRETTDEIEFFREQHGTGEMRQVLSMPFAPGAPSPLDGTSVGVAIGRMWVKGHTVYLQVDEQGGSSFVRIDTTGDHSDIPAQHVEGLRLESLDEDGTALLSRTNGDADQRSTELMVVRPRDHEPDVRATLGGTDLALIHQGVIYTTDGSDPERFTVKSVRSSGKNRDVTELYANKQVAGATWPEHGGATTAFMVTPRLLIEQQQAALQQQQAAAQARADALVEAQGEVEGDVEVAPQP